MLVRRVPSVSALIKVAPVRIQSKILGSNSVNTRNSDAQVMTNHDIDLVIWMGPVIHEEGFQLHVKGIKNGFPCIMEIRGTQGCALVGVSARAVGECRDVAKAQP